MSILRFSWILKAHGPYYYFLWSSTSGLLLGLFFALQSKNERTPRTAEASQPLELDMLRSLSPFLTIVRPISRRHVELHSVISQV